MPRRTKLDSVLAQLYTVERIERVSAKVLEWLTAARATLAAAESPASEAAALGAVRNCERVAKEAAVMGGVYTELTGAHGAMRTGTCCR